MSENMHQPAFSFTVFLSGVDVMTEEIADALVSAGCNDGSPFSRLGQAGIDFDRAAGSLQDAIRSAVANVHQAGFQVDRVELSQDALQTL
jgi:hypothetical protein